MPECMEIDMTRSFAVLTVASFLLLAFPLDMAGAQEDQSISCTVLVDWDEDWYLSLIHI